MSMDAPHDPHAYVTLQDLLLMEGKARSILVQSRSSSNRVIAGKHASKIRGRGLDFAEVRQYVRGDDVRNIDWKVTARTKVPHTKVFNEEKERPVFIAVAQNNHMFFGSQQYLKSVIAAKLAAMLSFRALMGGDRVGGMVLGDVDNEIIYPKRDRKNIYRFLERIVDRNQGLPNEQRPEDYERFLGNTIAQISRIITHDFLVILISDFPKYAPVTMKYLRRISMGNDVLLFKVSDPMERDLPAERMSFTDGSLDLGLDLSKDQLTDKMRSDYDKKLQTFESAMKKYRIPVFGVNTLSPVEQQVKQWMQGR